MKTISQTVREMPPMVRFLSIIVLLQLVLWTLVPSVLYTILPLDSLEAVAWGSGFSLGNAKHPPLTGWIAGLTASATGHADWPVYLLSQLCVTGGMACIYFMAREFFGREESAAAALTPVFIYYYSITTPEFNVNLPMLLLWPAAALCFVRAYRHDLILDWILLGLASGLCFLCKYYSVLLFTAFGVFLLLAKERRRLILSAGPWIAAASAFLMVLPHLMWAFTGGLAMMEEYVEGRMAFNPDDSWFHRHIAGVISILGTAAGVGAVPLVAFLLARLQFPRNPVKPARREALVFAAVMMGVPLLVLAVIGLSGNAVRAMWLVPLFFPLGILLTALFPAEWTPKQTTWFRLETAAFFLACLIGVAVAGAVHSTNRKNFPAKRFAADVSRLYEEKTGRPLEIMIGDAWASGLMRHYAPGHPQGCIWDNRCEVERLGPMLRRCGGLAVSDDPNDIDFAVEHFGTPDSPRMSLQIEYGALLGKKRTKTINLAFLDASAAK